MTERDALVRLEDVLDALNSLYDEWNSIPEAERALEEAVAEVRSLPRPSPSDVGRLREALEYIAEEHDAGRHDGLPEPCPAHSDVDMWSVARAALSYTEERGPMCRICGLQQVDPPNDMCTGCESYLERQP